MKDKWRNPEEELPKVGRNIWVLAYHWKERGVLSSEIIGGEV